MSLGVFDIWTNNRRPTSGINKKIIFFCLLISSLFYLIYRNCFSLSFPRLRRATKISEIFDDRYRIEQDDPTVLKYIRQKHLVKPASYSTHYKLTRSIHMPDAPLTKFLKRQRDGFFVEFGALDGEYMSNTLFLETTYGWKGLLVEGSPSKFQLLKSKNRKAWLANVCLSENHPEKIEFLKHNISERKFGKDEINPGYKFEKPARIPGINGEFKRSNYDSEGIVECFPLYSVLAAMNVTKVDLLSLKLNEYNILKGIPYAKLEIKVILVEWYLASESPELIQNLMREHSFKLVYESQSDFIFVKETKMGF